MLQGLTAHYLCHSTYPVKPGDKTVVTAAAGGVGHLLVQMIKRAGGWVAATVSTEEKAALARSAGADEVILYTQTDFEAEVKRLTGGAGVEVVYDSVGKTTFDKSLNCLKPRGYMVLYGQASGPVPPVDPQILNQKGSLFLTRPSLGAYILTREELLARSQASSTGCLRRAQCASTEFPSPRPRRTATWGARPKTRSCSSHAVSIHASVAVFVLAPPRKRLTRRLTRRLRSRLPGGIAIPIGTPVRHPSLYWLVFTSGAVTLGMELSASRLIEPAFGNNQIVWAALIGLILLCLAVGAWLGGRLADRYPRRRELDLVLTLAAVGVALAPALSRPVLRLAVTGMAALDVGLLAAALLAVLLLFSIPGILLGTASPWALRLSMHSIDESGHTAGRLYAISTAGSLLGTFLPVLWLIPAFGTRWTFYLLALPARRDQPGHCRARHRWVPLAGFVLVLLLALTTGPGSSLTGDWDGCRRHPLRRQSLYNYIVVRQ